MALDLLYDKFKPVTVFVQDHFEKIWKINLLNDDRVELTYYVNAQESLDDKKVESFFSACNSVVKGLEHNVDTTDFPYKNFFGGGGKKKSKKSKYDIKLPTHLKEVDNKIKTLEKELEKVRQEQKLIARNNDYSIELHISVY